MMFRRPGEPTSAPPEEPEPEPQPPAIVDLANRWTRRVSWILCGLVLLVIVTMLTGYACSR